jgi:hypothetical protein
MYGIFTCMWVIFEVNDGKYSIHGVYGNYCFSGGLELRMGGQVPNRS